MKYHFFLIIIIACFSLIITRKEPKKAKDLSPMDKDRYLACNGIAAAKLEKDKAIIDELLKGKQEFLQSGLKKIMALEMIDTCLLQLSDSDVQKVVIDLLPMAPKIDLNEVNIEYDYTPMKDKNEFIFEPHLTEIMDILKELINEANILRKKYAEDALNERKGSQAEAQPKEEPKKEAAVEAQPKEEPKKESQDEAKPKEEPKEEPKKEEPKLRTIKIIQPEKLEELLKQGKKKLKSVNDLSELEKEKFLACNIVLSSKLEKDKEKIEEVLQNLEDRSEQALARVMNLDSLLKCVSKITEEQTHKLVKGYLPLVETYNLEDFDYEFDYEPYKQKTELVYDEHYVESLDIIRKLVQTSEMEKFKKAQKEGKVPNMPRNGTNAGPNKPKRELTPIEKDKYLACNAVMITKIEEDKEKIDEMFKGKDDFLVKGLRRCLNLEMILSCMKQITEEQAHSVYMDLVPQVEKVDLKKVNFDFDYSPFKTKNEFIMDEKLVETMGILRDLVNEYGLKRRKMKMEKAAKEKEEANKNDKKEDDKKEDDKKGKNEVITDL